MKSNALGKIKDYKAVIPLLESLKDDNSYVRQSAIKALRRFNIFKK